MTPRAIILHTIGVRGDTTIAAVRRYHMTPESKGGPPGGPWRDVGYHALVRKDGTVEYGRLFSTTGSHTGGANDTWGIAVAGDGDSEPWTGRQWLAVLALVDRLRHRVPGVVLPVYGHREAPAALGAKPTSKTCPGRLVDMDEVRAALAAYHASVVAGRGRSG